MNVWVVFKSLNTVTKKKMFFSSLTDKKISDKEYEHALTVWNMFEIKLMKDYHDMYLKCDVLLSASDFENIRNNTLKNYGLRSSHYFKKVKKVWNACVLHL